MQSKKSLEKFWLFTICLLFLMPLFLGCTRQDKNNHKYKILVTTTPVGDLVKNLVDSSIEVDILMGPGVDPHSYTPSAGDVNRILESDMIISSGLHLEGKMGEIFQGLEEKKIAVFSLGDTLDKNSLILEEEGIYDPHIWWDVGLWSETIDPLADFLSQNLPIEKSQIANKAKAYKEKLLILDKETEERISSIPKEKRTLVTGHDAFSYFARAYNMEVLSIQGLNTNDEAGAGKMDTLAKYLAEHKIKAIFAETGTSGKNIQVLLEATQGYGFETEIGGHLYSDSLGKEGTNEGTYLGAVEANVDKIVNGLKEGK